MTVTPGFAAGVALHRRLAEPRHLRAALGRDAPGRFQLDLRRLRRRPHPRVEAGLHVLHHRRAPHRLDQHGPQRRHPDGAALILHAFLRARAVGD
jgi:hypothetical protein